jgi:hypothetical protein
LGTTIASKINAKLARLPFEFIAFKETGHNRQSLS